MYPVPNTKDLSRTQLVKAKTTLMSPRLIQGTATGAQLMRQSLRLMPTLVKLTKSATIYFRT